MLQLLFKIFRNPRCARSNMPGKPHLVLSVNLYVYSTTVYGVPGPGVPAGSRSPGWGCSDAQKGRSCPHQPSLDLSCWESCPSPSVCGGGVTLGAGCSARCVHQTSQIPSWMVVGLNESTRDGKIGKVWVFWSSLHISGGLFLSPCCCVRAASLEPDGKAGLVWLAPSVCPQCPNSTEKEGWCGCLRLTVTQEAPPVMLQAQASHSFTCSPAPSLL